MPFTICRTQSNNVQIIKIVPSSGSVDTSHRTVTKVTLGSQTDGSGKRRRHSVMSRPLTEDKSLHLENEQKLTEMKTTILRLMETKDSAVQENTTLRRCKSNLEKLKQENTRLRTKIENLNSKKMDKRHFLEDNRRQSPDGTEASGGLTEENLASKVSYNNTQCDLHSQMAIEG